MATEDREEFLLTGETRPLQCVGGCGRRLSSIRPPAGPNSHALQHLAVGRVELFIYFGYLSVLLYYLMSMSRRGDDDEIYITVLLDMLAYACIW